ncbi:hypothetical protein C1O51_06250 [Akkermansia muciniphila]|nr:hypothetical protein CXU05_05600 [Akkermansia muciniphila]QAA52820.1 hypothetical protein C1O50_06265 [Akkermansia muciniphila]QAA55127.1 hypothetical protein C1O51_06250 [Akkermansia muciniphila]QAA59759.1 hypothetical protein C1O57_06250 [Akkermansia muciniphila]QAR49312.1 hypothetical protein SI90_00580 [Akkermansia muciniphila]
MSVIQNLEDSGKVEEPFFQPGLRVFSHSAFLRREHCPTESGLFRFSLTRVCSYQPLPEPFILPHGRAVKMQIWKGGD